MSARLAIVLASERGSDPVITGLTLSERARRVAVRAGIAPADVIIARTPDELEAFRYAHEDRLGRDELLLIRADAQVVADSLVEPLTGPGTQVSVDPDYAGALVTSGRRSIELLDALVANFERGDRELAESWSDVERVAVDDRARHPAGTADEIRAAVAWQYELVNKPLDAAITVAVYRPLARPLTRLFLRTPLSPNGITLISAVLSLGGCAIAAMPSYWMHIIGLVILFAGGVVDCNDGEVARLRLEGSKLGAWLDAIGDDLARLALIAAIGIHVAPQYPDLPIHWATAGTVVLTLTSMLLIYWYCVFVIGSANNQDYGEVLGVGPGTDDAQNGSRTIVQRIGDLFVIVARRDFFDLAALALAIAGIPIVGFSLLALGSVVGLAIVLPTHIKLVRTLRQQRSDVSSDAGKLEVGARRTMG